MTTIPRLLTLRADLRDEAAAAEVTPEALAAYALRTGWALAAETPEHRVYRRGAAELHVPRDSGWPAYGRRVLAELAEIAAAEGRGTLQVWADVVGIVDPTANVVAHLDEALASMAARPAAHGTTSEAVLFQALLALEVRALLLGAPGPAAAYDALRAARGVPSSRHACHGVDLAGIGAVIAELTERATGVRRGDAPPCHDVARDGATDAADGPGAVQAPTEPATGQAALPGIEPGRQGRRASVHRWGFLIADSLPPDPMDPGRAHIALVSRCVHCDTLRRWANTGPRSAAVMTYSTDGRSWSRANPACVMKE